MYNKKMSKSLLIAGMVMLIIGVVFIFYAMSHPEASFNISLEATKSIYNSYIIIMMLLFIYSRLVKKNFHY